MCVSKKEESPIPEQGKVLMGSGEQPTEGDARGRKDNNFEHVWLSEVNGEL